MIHRSVLSAIAVALFHVLIHNAQAAPAAEVVAFQGRTEYRETTETGFKPVRVRLGLEPLTTVRTGIASWASLLFYANKMQIKYAADTEIYIKAVAGVPEGSTSTILEMLRGKSWGQGKPSGGTLTIKTYAVNAGITGTDWVIEVAADGRTSVAVLSGEIVLDNEHGSVRIGRNEEGIALPGQAPQKRALVDARERVQWVATHAIAWERYPNLLADPGQAGIIADARAGHNAESLAAIAATQNPSAALCLLAADIHLRSGSVSLARDTLEAGRKTHPDEPRFAASLVHLALREDRGNEAQRLLDEARKRWPDNAELLLASGELARWAGNAREAMTVFARANQLAPADARGYRNLGVIAGEREDYPAARQNLIAALERTPQEGNRAETEGELAWVDTLADDLAAARSRFDAALAADPSDYVALTGLGYLALKRGDTEEALHHLLAANVIEPRYARAVQYLGIAYYQQGRQRPALDMLARAAELDPHDPMPYFLTSLIHQDHWQPGEAVRAAIQSMERLPFLKSMNQLASDLQGSANLGAAYAQFGLEASALRAAHESYDPFWAGSHFFLGRSYGGEFSRNAELTLGFLTDPTAFGTARRFQPLVATPGASLRAQLWMERGGANRTDVPALSANGYHNDGMPFAWFAEAQHQRLRQDGLGAEADQFTLGLGLKPTSELRFFLFANSFTPDVTQPRPGGTFAANGHNQRIDIGGSWRHGPEQQTWLKFGSTRETSRIDQPDALIPTTRVNMYLHPERDDAQLRHTLRLASGSTLSGGIEQASRRDDADSTRYPLGSARTSLVFDRSLDRTTVFWGGIQTPSNQPWQIEAQLAQTRLASETTRDARLANGLVTHDGGTETSERSQPRLGGTLRFAPEWTLRAAWQDWTRPVSFNTLAPIATAGIPVDDIYTLPGGRLQRTRMQLEWQRPNTLTMLWADTREIRNIGFNPIDGADNRDSELADLSRLDQRALQTLSLDAPEGTPVFGGGRISEAGIAFEQILSDTLSLRLRYRAAQSRNTRWYPHADLPYTPRHQAGLGFTWLPAPRWMVQAQAIRRSGQFMDENNATLLKAGWEGTILSSWQTPRKDWQVDAYLRSSPGLTTTGGLAVVWRY